MRINKLCLYIILVILTSLANSGCGDRQSEGYQGYVEGEARYLAAPFGGVLIKRPVRRGDAVKAQALLFQLDLRPESYQLQVAKDMLAEGLKTYQDLKMPKRIPVIDAIHKQIEQINAELGLAEIREGRYQKLFQKNATSQDRLDEISALKTRLLYRKQELFAELELAKLGSRDKIIEAQQEKLSQLQQEVLKNKWIVQQKSVVAPIDGVIQDTFFKEGEYVPAQKPVLALLSDEDIYIEFFVPVKGFGQLKVNQQISFKSYDDTLIHKAHVTYISKDAEYMPPLVYSRKNMDKLVYRVKARPKNPKRLTPGQPVSVQVSHE